MVSDDSPPPIGKLLWEIPAILALLANQMRPAVLREPFGRGQPVVVVPGFLASDVTSALLRRTLKACGFVPYGWRQGVNWGANRDRMDRLTAQVRSIARQSGRRVVLVGWSLGGVYAREVARSSPDDVSCVVTLASPFSGDPRSNNGWKLYELLNDHPVDRPPIGKARNDKPPVHTVAVWSAQDGMIAPASARGLPDEADERIELSATHMGIGSDPDAVKAIVRLVSRLSRSQGHPHEAANTVG